MQAFIRQLVIHCLSGLFNSFLLMIGYVVLYIFINMISKCVVHLHFLELHCN